MPRLHRKSDGLYLGAITDDDLNVLIDHLEEEHGADADYFINAATIDLLVGAGASTALVTLLRSAVGDSDGIEVGWTE
ncbi:MAG: galactosyldiacylglycerol synthase [Steroidobacteraceae bacterium]